MPQDSSLKPECDLSGEGSRPPPALSFSRNFRPGPESGIWPRMKHGMNTDFVTSLRRPCFVSVQPVAPQTCSHRSAGPAGWRTGRGAATKGRRLTPRHKDAKGEAGATGGQIFAGDLGWRLRAIGGDQLIERDDSRGN